MNKKRPHPSTALRAVILVASLQAAYACAAAPDPAAPDVLDLKQAAQLLRVPTRIVVKLAQSGSIPARRLASEWRFNRVALMEWLQGDRYAYPAVPKKAAEVAARLGPAGQPLPVVEGTPAEALGSGLTIAELSTIRGAGRAETLHLAQVPTAPATQPGELPRPIGERPTGPTAEETALREQGIALLQGGAKTVEFGISYSRRARDLERIGTRDETNLVSATLTGRYGLRDDLQITVRQPYFYRRDIAIVGEAPGEFVRSRATDHYAGDLALNLAGVALRENVGRPSLLWTVDAVLPTGPGDVGLGGGLVVSKSYDPVVVFAGANYLYGSKIDAADPRRNLSKHNWGFNLGYAYAVNDALALSGQFAGTYRTRDSLPSEALPPERESYFVQLGMTWQLGRGLFVDPNIAFRVGGAAADMAFSTNLIYSF